MAETKTFPVLRTAFSGFPFLLKRFWVLPFWALATAGVILALQLLIVFASNSESLKTLGTMDGQQMLKAGLETLSTLLFFITSLIFLLTLYIAMLACAAARVAFAPSKFGFAYLRAGSDERRTALGQVCILGLTLLVELAFTVAIIVIAAWFSTSADGAPTATMPVPGIVATTALGIAGAILGLLLLSRFALVTPLAVDQKTFGLVSSWKMTKGLSWRILGTLAIAWTVAAVISYLVAILAVVVAILLGVDLSLPPADQLSNPLQLFLGPYMMTAFVVTGIMMSIFTLLTTIPVVRIYQTLLGRGGSAESTA